MTLEAELRERFVTREEPFHHGSWRPVILLPRAADELIDEGDFERDERLPYWAELWPSARALTRHLLDNPPAERGALELGAGVALPSLALATLGVDVLATDWYEDALRFAEANAARNRITGLRTAVVDWTREDTRAAPLVIAADVLYEQRNAVSLAAALPRWVAPGGRALLADPGRVHAREFRNALTLAGWTIREVDRRDELSDPASGRTSSVAIWELRSR